jgi:hypothetical protein
MTIVVLTREDLRVAQQAIDIATRRLMRPMVLVDMIHTADYPYCSDPACPCHGEDGSADFGDALLEGRVSDGVAFYGEKPIRPRVA